MKGLEIIAVNEAPDGTKTLVIYANGTGHGGGMRELPVSEEIFQMWLTCGSIVEGRERVMSKVAAALGVHASKQWVLVEPDKAQSN